MKLIWHTYERAEGKTTEALEIFKKTEDSILITIDDLNCNNIKLHCTSEKAKMIYPFNHFFNNIRGLHPKMLIIDELPENSSNLNYLSRLALDHIPIHIFTTLEPAILKILFNPKKTLDRIAKIKEEYWKMDYNITLLFNKTILLKEEIDNL